MAYSDPNQTDTTEAQPPSVVDYVIDKREAWRTDYESNYKDDHDEYYRLWRAKWRKEDQQRQTERSQLIAPALQQAVESSCAELEEATFGRGKFFDIRDDIADQEPGDIEILKNALSEEFSKNGIRKETQEVILNAAVTGTGLAEVVLEEYTELRPATRPAMGGQLQEFGVESEARVRVKLRSVRPGNFLIQPSATCVNSSVGVILDEFVPIHQVEELQAKGVYKKCDLEEAAPNTNIEVDRELDSHFQKDRVRLTKYYGLVPKYHLQGVDTDSPWDMVEAVVVIANDGQLLKAVENPYMMKDRPIVAFQWDIVPGRFWGRGVCEKGYMSQKALDTEMRMRIDSLALVAAPMMAIDATRMPRGFNAQVRPGKNIYTQGDPKDIFREFNFGTLDANTFTQGEALQQMVQQATGAVDSTGLLSSVSGETKAGAVSMSLGAVIKRHKRTLVNFQESFLLPFIEKAAWRYMQFDPENFPVQDYKFIASSTLGIIAREYEVSQLITLLQTMSHESPLYPILIKSIVDNMNLSNREKLLQTLDQAAQPTEQEMQAQQVAQQQQQEQHEAQVGVFHAQAAESNARAEKYRVEAQLEPQKVKNDLIQSITEGMDSNEGDAQEFNRRMEILKGQLDIRKQGLAEAEAKHRMKMEERQSQQSSDAEQKLLKKLGMGGSDD